MGRNDDEVRCIEKIFLTRVPKYIDMNVRLFSFASPETKETELRDRVKKPLWEILDPKRP